MTSPAKWDRTLAAEAVSAITRMRIGDFTSRGPLQRRDRVGQPLSPPAQVAIIQALRLFFRDAQEWEWIPRRFTPARAFAIPPERPSDRGLGPSPTTTGRSLSRRGSTSVQTTFRASVGRRRVDRAHR